MLGGGRVPPQHNSSGGMERQSATGGRLPSIRSSAFAFAHEAVFEAAHQEQTKVDPSG